MVPPLLDTNVFIRHLTHPNPNDPESVRQAQQAYELFKRIEAGTEQVFTLEAVIVEVVQVLSSKALYHLPRQDISAKLTQLLSLSGLKLPLKVVIVNALQIYASGNLDFVDSLLIARDQKEGQKSIISFDRDFDKMAGIRRREP